MNGGKNEDFDILPFFLILESNTFQELCEWDHTHNDIEVYDRKGIHLGSMDPVTGELYKGPEIGRDIKDKIK